MFTVYHISSWIATFLHNRIHMLQFFHICLHQPMPQKTTLENETGLS